MGNNQTSEILSRDNFAYRVIKVTPSEEEGTSPLEPYLDFIMYTPQNDLLFSEYLKQHAGKPVCLKVYNILQRGTRLVTLVPAAQGGSTSEELIGAKLRFENYTEAHTYLVAIKDVYLGGPAHQSSLHPHCDFIVGTPELTFTDVQVFAKYLQVNKGQEIDLVVYNLNEEACRHVRLTPSDEWGRRDQGLIGAEVCMGLLNTIPER